MKKLNEALDRLIIKSKLSLDEQNNMLKEIAERNGMNWLLEQIRARN